MLEARPNTTEDNLRNWWRIAPSFPCPMLDRLSVSGTPNRGLRGIQNLSIEFKYPLTAICGRNGSGKTTALALAALGFHSPPKHVPANAYRRPKRGEDYTYYTFRDFFFKGPGDPDITGLEIGWQYRYGRDVVNNKFINKRTKRWMSYESRPKRPTHYLGVIRSIPAIEQSTLRSRFKANATNSDSSALNEEYCGYLTEIMGRTYHEAGTMASDRYFLRQCKSGHTYSSFNMGAGEDVLIELLSVLQECPKGSLIVIEEVELGLHPEAQTKLARYLQEIMWEKKLQVIVSTHSQYFLDSVPREARIFLEGGRDRHTVIQGPSTRVAVGGMSEVQEPDLDVYCEDNVAELLIRQALPADVRTRVRILPMGADNELARQGRFHLRTRHDQERHMLLVWDGDATPGNKVDGFLKKADLTKDKMDEASFGRLNWITLPGGTAPEKWMLEVLDCNDGYEALRSLLNASVDEVAGYIERLKNLNDHHKVGYELGRLSGLPTQTALERLVMAVSNLPSRPLDPVHKAIESVLETGFPPVRRTL